MNILLSYLLPEGRVPSLKYLLISSYSSSPPDSRFGTGSASGSAFGSEAGSAPGFGSGLGSGLDPGPGPVSLPGSPGSAPTSAMENRCSSGKSSLIDSLVAASSSRDRKSTFLFPSPGFTFI